MKRNFGDTVAREVSGRIATPVATLTELKAIPADSRVHGMRVLNLADFSTWFFHSTSVVVGDDILVATPSAGSGAWLRGPGGANLVLPFTFATADAAVLLTMPTGAIFQPIEFAWRVTSGFTGGSSSAIGVSSAKTGFTTKGDLLGGAGGDVAATLVAGNTILGTIGGKWATIANRRGLWVAGDTFRFDRITSAFTAGVGAAVVAGILLENAGA